MKVLLAGINAQYIHVSLAVYSLAASCRMAGCEVDTAEYTINQEFLQILGDVADRRPDVACFACYVWNREMLGKLSLALKKILPQIRIVLGGPEVSAVAANVLTNCRAVDYVVQGEGEESLPELLQKLADGEAPVAVCGVAERTESGICLNGGIRVVELLDRLPFPYNVSLLEGFRNRILYYESSRGCPFACSYCVSGMSGGVRRRSLEKVKEELRFFLDQGAMQVKFVDRTFNVDPEHYCEIWRFLLAWPGRTGFHFEIVADMLSEADLQLLAQAPKRKFQFEIGVQSTHADTLAAIGRTVCWERLAQNVKSIAQAGNIHLHLDLIAGLPKEDWRSFAASFNATYSLRPDMLQIGFLKLLPGTRIRQAAETYGYQWLDGPPYELLSNDVLPYGDVRRLKILEEVFNQTYNSGRFVHTLSYFVTVCNSGDAFAFYHKLSQWWYERGYIGTAASPEGVLNRLNEFARQLAPVQRQWVDELLKVDALIEGRRALKGEGLSWNGESWAEQKNELWRSEAGMRRYAPEYAFSNWREVKRRYPIEVFSVSVTDWLADGTAVGEKWTPVLFEVDRADFRWHSLSQSDFPTEKSR